MSKSPNRESIHQVDNQLHTFGYPYSYMIPLAECQQDSCYTLFPVRAFKTLCKRHQIEADERERRSQSRTLSGRLIRVRK